MVQIEKSPMSEVRYWYLDALRSILIVLVVVLHCSNIYSVSADWRVSDPSNSIAFDLITGAIATFVMPAFFLIAGFFSALSLNTHGTSGFLKSRMMRLGIPLISTALTFNLLQMYVCVSYQSEQPLGFLSFIRNHLPEMWLDGQWVSHLWFLICLLIFSAVGILAWRFGNLNGLANSRPFHRTLAILRYKQAFLLVVPLFCMLPLVLGQLWPALIYESHFFHTVSALRLLHYFPYYLVGMWVFSDRELQAEYSAVRFWQVGALLLALLGVFSFDENGGLWERIVNAYSDSLISWLSCVICLCLAKRFLDRKSRLFSYLSGASLSIYLSHHLMVVWLGFMLLSWPLPGAVKFLLVLSIALTFSLTFHSCVVLRVPLFRFLFTGKPILRPEILRSS